MSSEILSKIEKCGTVRVAEACGVTSAAVSTWRRRGMPKRKEVQARVKRYERIISALYMEIVKQEEDKGDKAA